MRLEAGHGGVRGSRDVLVVEESAVAGGGDAESPAQLHTRTASDQSGRETREGMSPAPSQQDTPRLSSPGDRRGPVINDTDHGHGIIPTEPKSKEENGTLAIVSKDKWLATDSSSEGSSSDVHHFIMVEDGEQMLRKRHIVEKLVFTLSVVTLIAMAYGIVTMHWLLPYYYAITTPILIVIRIVMYCKNKWQYFLIDFCYFANCLCYIYIWAFPEHPYVFTVMFGFANGPLAWAVLMFRNSLVLHSTDKMTSMYIHLLPLFLMYSVRWYSSSISQHWYKPFISMFDESIPFIFSWLVAVPMAGFVLHMIFYIVLVHGILRPKEEYMNTYRYLSSDDTCMGKLFSILGTKYKFVMFTLGLLLYCLLSLLSCILWYKYFIAHTVFVAFVCLLTTWNGASFYMDVFSVKGFKADS